LIGAEGHIQTEIRQLDLKFNPQSSTIQGGYIQKNGYIIFTKVVGKGNIISSI
jgi:hypothetical protein